MFGLFKRKKNDEPVYRAYNLIVAQARQPVFYTDYAVPDTPEGRFENIVLHIFLLLHRLKPESESDREFGQLLFDLFFADMDRSLREAGVGDISVPKRVKKMAEAFYGRVKAYDEALSKDNDEELAERIGRYLYVDTPSGAVLAAFAAYVRESAKVLSGLPVDAILAGEVAYAAPRAGEVVHDG